MKKKSIFSYFAIVATFLLLTNLIKLYALNYTISFTGSGASTTIDNVIVYNLTKGTTVTVQAGNVLNLTDVTTEVENLNIVDEEIQIFPNPIKDYANISFYAKNGGYTQISAYSLDGRKITETNVSLLQGNNSLKMTLPKGIYLIKIQGNEFSYHAKAISEITINPTPSITFSQSGSQNKTKPQKTRSEVISMLYSAGDQLLYKGKYGNYTTIVTDIPNSDKTTNFEFIECKDADNNHYAVVKIGSQTWMAENLRTSKFQNGDLIATTTPASLNISNEVSPIYQWSFDGIENNVSAFGRLYSWYAISDNRNLAPTGWHVSRDDEWKSLELFLGMNQNSLDDTGWRGVNEGFKLKSTTGWSLSSNSSNSSGFSATPAGLRDINNSFNSLSAGYWWCSDEFGSENAWSRSLFPDRLSVSRGWGFTKKYGLSVRCIKNSIPIMSSTTISNIKSYLVDCESSVVYNGGSEITSKGFCWSKTSNPSINDSKIISNSPSNLLTLEVSVLEPNTTYFLRSFAVNQEGVAYGSQVSFTTTNLKLGDLYKGGSIAYIFQVGDPGYIEGEIHGLIANLYDLSTGIRWGGTSITAATSGSIGSGQSNTNKIIDTLGEGSYAARLCYDLVIDNYDDWYLPSFNELEKIYYGAKSIISGQGYWSSTEISNTYAYCKFFGGTGGPVTNTKATQYRVRAVRNF